ncbi:MAG: hypothetical protein Q8M31_08585 [Beijerinckiaceae bacterium]|nr:hypothetical protein [Beijerinckiaceae bacterium]
MNAQRNNLDANEGFAAKPLTADLARHQLHVSLGVMGVILAAGVAMFSTFGMASGSATTELRAEITVQQPHFVHPMTAQTTRNDHTGG